MDVYVEDSAYSQNLPLLQKIARKQHLRLNFTST